MPVQRPIEELAAVVGVEVLYHILHGLFECPQLNKHCVHHHASVTFSLSQLGSAQKILQVLAEPVGILLSSLHGQRLSEIQGVCIDPELLSWSDFGQKYSFLSDL